MKRTWLAAGIAATMALGVAACGSSSSSGSGSSSASAPITIGLLIPLTHSLSDPKLWQDPAAMAAAEINASGGIKGHKVIVKSYDSDFTTQGAITSLQK